MFTNFTAPQLKKSVNTSSLNYFLAHSKTAQNNGHVRLSNKFFTTTHHHQQQNKMYSLN